MVLSNSLVLTTAQPKSSMFSNIVGLAFGTALEKKHQPSSWAISVKTDLKSYTESDNIKITGLISSNLSNSSSPVKQVVTLETIKSDEQVKGITDRFSLLTAEDGSFGANLTIGKAGQYQVIALVDPNGTVINASTRFEVIDIWHTAPAIMLWIGTVFFVALLIVIYLESRRDGEGQEPFQTRSGAALEVTRFFLITGITFSFVIALLFANTTLGSNSPLGIVRQQNPGQNQTQWVINVGGIPKNGEYRGGIQVPVLIVVLGTLGGYLRYLYGLRYLYATRRESQNPQIVDRGWADIDITERSALFKHSLRSLGLIFLSPLLAIGTWFLLMQAGVQGIWTLALVSLSVGLITDEVIRTLIQFARNVLGGIKGIGPQQQGPRVTGKTPDDGSENVSINPTITATFSDTIDKRTINVHSFRLSTTDSSNNITEVTGGKVDLSADNKMATLVPPTLDYSTNYTVKITTEVKDLGGNGLTTDVTWSFKTMLLISPKGNRGGS